MLITTYAKYIPNAEEIYNSEKLTKELGKTKSYYNGISDFKIDLINHFDILKSHIFFVDALGNNREETNKIAEIITDYNDIAEDKYKIFAVLITNFADMVNEVNGVGQHLNVNVLNREDLIRFRDYPETFDVAPVIRISGYAVSVDRLSKEQLNEIINRTYHGDF